jgi:hypothetical protein
MDRGESALRQYTAAIGQLSNLGGRLAPGGHAARLMLDELADLAPLPIRLLAAATRLYAEVAPALHHPNQCGLVLWRLREADQYRLAHGARHQVWLLFLWKGIVCGHCDPVLRLNKLHAALLQSDQINGLLVDARIRSQHEQLRLRHAPAVALQ